MSARDARLDALVGALDEDGPLTVEGLGGVLGVSPATVRRYLAELTHQRRIVRTRGGARLFRPEEETPIPVRDALAREAKLTIARAAADLVPPGRLAVAIGGGTTTAAVLEALGHREDVTVVTNALTIATRACRLRFERVVVVGGYVRRASQELVGTFAEHTFAAVKVAVAVLGSGGITAAGGITTHDEAEARTNHAMIAAAQRSIVVADGSKLGHLALAPLATVEEIHTIVTDATAPPEEVAALRASGVQVVVADG